MSLLSHAGDHSLPEITEPPRDRTSLHELARVGDTLALIKLLDEMPKFDSEKVMEIDAPDDSGNTALHLACGSNNLSTGRSEVQLDFTPGMEVVYTV